MSHVMKARLFCAAMVILSGGLTAWNWSQLSQTGSYYPKIALLMPVCLVIFFLFMLFPGLLEQPRDKKSEIIVTVVGLIGLALGGLNWYVMLRYG